MTCTPYKSVFSPIELSDSKNKDKVIAQQPNEAIDKIFCEVENLEKNNLKNVLKDDLIF